MLKFFVGMALVLVTAFAHADRIRDLTSVQGVREKLADWLWVGGGSGWYR